MLYLGAYVPSKDPSAPGWELPPGANASLDLSRTGQTPVGLFEGNIVDSGYTLLSDSPAMLARERAAWLALVGSIPTGVSLAEAIFHAFTAGSDPEGLAGPYPIMPNTRRRLRVSFGTRIQFSRKWGSVTDLHFNKVRQKLRLDLNAARSQALAGEVKDEFGNVDFTAHRRLLRWHSRKLGVSDSDIKPAEWRADEGGIDPRTTVSDDFARANEVPLTTPWTARQGTIYLQNESMRTVGVGGNMYQHQSSVSGTDHYCQYTILDSNGLVSHDLGVVIGPVSRHTGTSTETAYHARMRLSDGLTQLYSIVSGSFSAILSSTGPSWATGDIIQLECDGSDIGIKQNGAYVLSTPVTNTAVSSGNYGGVRGFGANGLADDWSISDISAGTPVFRGLSLLGVGT